MAAPRMSIGNARVVEGYASYRVVVFAVTLSEATNRTVSVSYRTSNGTARAGSDYIARSGRISIRAGTRSAKVSIAVKGDRSRERHETFRVTLSSASGATIARPTATGTILNDDTARTTGRLRVSVGDASVTEGDSGGRYVWLPVTLSAKANRTVAVRYRTVPVTASSRWGDFVAASGVVRIPAGATSTTIPVIVRGDRRSERDESFRVDLTHASGASAALYRTRGIAVIRADDGDTGSTNVPPRGPALFAWGYNLDGQVNSSDTDSYTTPTPVGSALDWQQVTVGGYHVCGIRAPGTLWCWGMNTDGQVGDGSTTERRSPTRVGTASDWTHVSAGNYHTCGIRAGNLYCWGSNNNSQVDATSTTTRLSPYLVSSSAGWTDVSAGYDHSCALFSGDLYCWGSDDDGQLGRSSTRARGLRRVDARSGSWTAVSAGYYHTCGIWKGGLWCTGKNGDGQLGDGSTTNRSGFVSAGSATDWTQVSAGGYHTCAIRSGGLWCWGSGPVGDGSTGDHAGPVRVGAASDWQQVSAGGAHTCAIRSGTLWCWGWNAFGPVGDGSVTERNVPTRIGSAADWRKVSAGDYHTSAGIRG